MRSAYGPPDRPSVAPRQVRQVDHIHTDRSVMFFLLFGLITKQDVSRHRIPALSRLCQDQGGLVIIRFAPRGTRTRSAALLAVLLLAVGVSLAVAAPASAQAAPVGYVRLAHLSPDTPDVDVYLSKQGDASFTPQVFKGVGYGVVSQYLPVPTGTYAVAMRLKGADPSTPPVISTTVTVAADAAYTVAGVGKHADLGLTVFTDDLSTPAAHDA